MDPYEGIGFLAAVPLEVPYFLLGPAPAEQFPGMAGERGQGLSFAPTLIRLPAFNYMLTVC